MICKTVFIEATPAWGKKNLRIEADHAYKLL
jgi:hypothetical protein